MKKLRTFKRGAVTIMAVDEALIEEVALSLRETAEDLFSEGNLRLVVDLGAVPFVDSPGLETLLDLHTVAEDSGGSFCLASPNAVCRDILKATRLDQVIFTYTSLEEATRSFL